MKTENKTSLMELYFTEWKNSTFYYLIEKNAETLEVETIWYPLNQLILSFLDIQTRPSAFLKKNQQPSWNVKKFKEFNLAFSKIKKEAFFIDLETLEKIKQNDFYFWVNGFRDKAEGTKISLTKKLVSKKSQQVLSMEEYNKLQAMKQALKETGSWIDPDFEKAALEQFSKINPVKFSQKTLILNECNVISSIVLKKLTLGLTSSDLKQITQSLERIIKVVAQYESSFL